MRRYQSALVLVFIFLWCVPVFAQGNADVLNLAVEGNAAINQNDVASARDGAIQEALQRAIQEAASVLLSVSVKDKKFLPVKNKIIKQQDRYINNYKITAEGQRGGTYFATVNVVVALSDLKNDLAKMGFRQISGEEKTYISISLEVKGLKKYSDFTYLKEFLKKRAKIVKSVHSRSFEWQQAHLKLEISGTAQALATELARTGRYILDTEKIEKNQIAISLLPREVE
ncbi:MAG: hypothetical protein AB2L12_11775 [Smithellaceae bacterium]